MSDKILKERLLAIKAEMLMNYNTIGIYCGLSKSQSNYVISKFIKREDYRISENIKYKIDEFLNMFGY